MKTNVTTYVLLAGVVLIWFYAFKRIKGNVLNEKVQIIKPIEKVNSFSPVVRDTFKLLANYKDPFGETDILTKELDKKPTRPTNKIKPAIRISQFEWPSVQYYGMVRKTQSSNPLAIITVDEFQLMGRKGEELFDGIFLSKIYRDSVLLTYKKRRKYFKRNP